MSRLMQLPAIFIRGAIATQTMKSLTREQIEEVDKIVRIISKDQSLIADKHEFITQLGRTIKGDYKSDRNAAQQEFNIAIWRATVYLLFHKSYGYKCNLCGANEYTTVAGKQAVINKQYIVCPSCQKSYDKNNNIITITKSQNGYTGKSESGDIIGPFEEKAKLEKHLKTPIAAISGDKRIIDPEKVLNDESQRNKWYTIWIWNYFRQILNENIIKVHNKRSSEITDYAHIVAFKLIIDQLHKLGHKYILDDISTKSGNKIEIYVNILHTNPDFSLYLNAIIKEYSQYGVSIEISPNCITIIGSTSVPIISAVVDLEDQVMMLSMQTPNDSNGDDSNKNWIDIIEHNSINKRDDETIILDSSETINVVRSKLGPDAKIAFDILCHTEPVWSEYCDECNTKIPKKSAIAEFLKVSDDFVDKVYCEISNVYTKCM